jgi:hypothetical protein
MALDTDKLNEFLGRFVGDLGATVAAASVVIGHNVGLYKGLAGGPATAAELADRTATNPRYVAEWLRGQAASGYVQYDPATDNYSMTEEQAFVLTDPDVPVYAPGALAASSSSVTATSPTWRPRGSQRWTAWPISCRPAPRWPTSAAGSAPRRS